MRVIHTVVLVLLLLALGAPAAAADTLTATLRQPLREVAHEVDVRLKKGVAVFTIRRTFANAGKRHEEASLRIHLPYGAAATGLRIRGQGKKRWYKGELMEATKAAALYKKLTGFGPHAPKDPALLYWVWANEVHLQVFPVAPGGKSTVEYTLTVPTRYADGRYTLSYPRHGGAKNLAVPILRIHSADKQSKITVNGRLASSAQSIALRRTVVKPLPGSIRRMGSASYTVSTLRISRRGRIRTVKVAVDIRHTYKGDLQVHLVSPGGKTHLLHNKVGGSDNNVRKTYEVKLGETTPVAGTWHLVVADHARMDVGQLVAWSVAGKVGARTFRYRAGELPLVLPDAPASSGDLGQATIRITPPKISTLAGRLGRVVASAKKQYLRMELDLAPQLRALPKDLSVVFLVDASHSMDPKGISQQLALIRAYLSHVPKAHFEVVLYRRFAKRMVGRFAQATAFTARVKTARKAGKLAPGNGSALDRGLALAAKLLRERRGTLRMVMFSDNLLRPSWKNRRALKELARAPRSTIAHVVLPDFSYSASEATEKRLDTHRLSPLAAKHGGVLLRMEGPDKPDHKTLVPVVLGLVRPIRIDNVRVRGLPRSHGLSVPTTLNEGVGLREMAQVKFASRKVTLVGKIWATTYRKTLRVNRRFTRSTAAFVFSQDLHRNLTKAEMMRVAKLGRVVSPVTSYLAIEPGVRPSTAGIDRRGRGGGAGMGGRGYGVGRIVKRTRVTPDLKALMKPHVKRCVALHKPTPGWNVSLRVETTLDEVVDVILRKKPTALGRCLVEGAWTIRLTRHYDLRHETFQISLP
jgi:subtilisin-like proprotein convertase family protein